MMEVIKRDGEIAELKTCHFIKKVSIFISFAFDTNRYSIKFSLTENLNLLEHRHVQKFRLLDILLLRVETH